MDPLHLLGYLIIIVVCVALGAYFRPRRKAEAVYGTDDGQADVQRPRDSIDDANEGLSAAARRRVVGKHPTLPAGYKGDPNTTFGRRFVPPTKKPVVVLTPRQIERVNTLRRQRGYPPLNRTGIKNAISAPWDSWRREPATTNDWLTYLILWEVFADDHKASTCSGHGGFTIDPNQPYNGQGGEFAGAGASGSWTSPPSDVSGAAAGIAVGASAAYLSDPDSFKGSSDNDPKYSPGETVGGYTAPDPTPSYSAPDPSPSPSYSGSSYSSSDSSSSSSSSSPSSSDSGSSGGGDSGGGGGGD